jgi:hypothetical protein
MNEKWEKLSPEEREEMERQRQEYSMTDANNLEAVNVLVVEFQLKLQEKFGSHG